MKHMAGSNLFSKKQHGFLPGRSIVVQLIQVCDSGLSLLIEDGQWKWLIVS